MDDRLALVEIFDSVQGEGHFTGTPCTFIRLAGCPLSCSFCDTDKTVHRRLTIGQILQQRLLEHVVLTGGEPTANPNLYSLLLALTSARHFVQVETNGWDDKGHTETTRTWWTLSPKKELFILPHVRQYDEAKWLIPEWTYPEISRLRDVAKEHYVQAVNERGKIDLKNTLDCVSLALEHPWLKVSFQVHKLIGVK